MRAGRQPEVAHAVAAAVLDPLLAILASAGGAGSGGVASSSSLADVEVVQAATSLLVDLVRTHTE